MKFSKLKNRINEKYYLNRAKVLLLEVDSLKRDIEYRSYQEYLSACAMTNKSQSAKRPEDEKFVVALVNNRKIQRLSKKIEWYKNKLK